jgi:aminoglycoside phosphotransferase family enzyme/predicted kinase
METDRQAEILAFLQKPENYPHPVRILRHVETHISHVFLTGEYAYKLKKIVKFDFLDFSTLEKRKHCCEEELRLNRRFAPELYLEVLALSRHDGRLHMNSQGEAVEYLVKMRQFDENSLFDELAARGELGQCLLLQITDVIARFHNEAAAQPEYWSYEYISEAIKQTLAGCAEFSPAVIERVQIELLGEKLGSVILGLQDLIRRRQETHVRELHGDLHLKNMCVYRKRAQLFDGIEFNPKLSNCDVWADLAFFIMDLLFRGLEEEAALVWNHYLQETDDFEGFRLLDLYVSYRAAIRARISCLEIESAETEEARMSLEAAAGEYISLALRSLEPHRRKIIAVGGLAGTGKSTLSSLLAQQLQAVHVRSDAVRKHLCGVPTNKKAPQAAYSEEMNKRTYRGMLERAYKVLEANRTVILDAVYHSSEWREEVEALAEEMSIPFVGLWCEVSPKVAQERVRMRIGDISDADESVVALQQQYDLGVLEWHRIDTSRHEQQSVAAALTWI